MMVVIYAPYLIVDAHLGPFQLVLLGTILEGIRSWCSSFLPGSLRTLSADEPRSSSASLFSASPRFWSAPCHTSAGSSSEMCWRASATPSRAGQT